VLAQEFDQAIPVFGLSSQLRQERKAYYEALHAAQHASATTHAQGGIEVTAWVKWFVGVFARACANAQTHVQSTVAKAAFWQQVGSGSLALNDRQRKLLHRLLDAGDGGFLGDVSAEKYIAITGASKPTATRDLAQLRDAGLLLVRGQGKGTRYAVAVPGWHLGFLG
jgi:Fic family protein